MSKDKIGLTIRNSCYNNNRQIVEDYFAILGLCFTYLMAFPHLKRHKDGKNSEVMNTVFDDFKSKALNTLK